MQGDVPMYDILIQNGLVIDGTGSPAMKSQVAIKDGKIAIKGWIEKSDIDAYDFCEKMQRLGVKTIICTDISKDGAMKGANHALYRTLCEKYDMQIVASGGVSSVFDVEKLATLDIYGAIIGKAYYTGAIELEEAINKAKR